jgi:hypothetical protein
MEEVFRCLLRLFAESNVKRECCYQSRLDLMVFGCLVCPFDDHEAVVMLLGERLIADLSVGRRSECVR